jgi:tetratricopeptide (TPR) repeat protein
MMHRFSATIDPDPNRMVGTPVGQYVHFQRLVEAAAPMKPALASESARQHRFCRLPTVLLALNVAMGWSAAAVLAESENFILGDWVFPSKQAVEYVQTARQFDPMYCPPAQRDRDRAIEFYKLAIAADPAASVGAKLMERIAQLYSFYYEPGGPVRPEPALATSYWRAVIDRTNHTDLLWAQAHMGLASASVMQGDGATAVQAYDAILSIDPAALRLPAWRLIPPTEQEAHLREVMKSLAEMRHTCVANLGHLAPASHHARHALQGLTSHADSDLALEAAKQLAAYLVAREALPWEMPPGLTDDDASYASSADRPRPGTPEIAHSPPVLSARRHEGDPRWLWAVGAVALAVAATGWRWSRRPRERVTTRS